MTRWLAIPVAALIAVAAGVVSWTTTPTPTEAGTDAFTMSIDCDVATGGIQTNCVTSAGAFAADVVVTNNSGSSIIVGAFGFNLIANQNQLNPTTPACDPSGLNCNPDFNQAAVTGASFACAPPAPVADNNPDPAIADSFIGCFSSLADGPTVANGASIVLARVSYTAADGVTDMSIVDGNFYDENFGELGSCNAVISVPMTCADSTVQIGASAATSTPTNTPTNTVVVPTNTPCVVGQTCATATSLAYVTVTPTPDPSTATAAAGTTVPGTTPGAPPPPPPPPPPGGGTAPGSGGTITLPDTGSDGGSDASMWMIALVAAAAVGTAGLASGLWFSTAAARRQGED